jgi:hypothetical protein
MILWTAVFGICALVGFVSSRTDSTKYLDSCVDAGGTNSFFKMDENVPPGYVMYVDPCLSSCQQFTDSDFFLSAPREK